MQAELSGRRTAAGDLGHRGLPCRQVGLWSCPTSAD